MHCVSGTCRGGSKHHGLGPGDAQVPDAIPVANILLQQLADSPRAGGGLETGHNLGIG